MPLISSYENRRSRVLGLESDQGAYQTTCQRGLKVRLGPWQCWPGSAEDLP